MALGFISCICAISIGKPPMEFLLIFWPNAENRVVSGCRKSAKATAAISGQLTAFRSAGRSIG